jgi:ABC-2 type transport system ATP-binding protein
VSVPAIRLEALTKYYGTVVGLEGLSLEVGQGDVFGFLGANGAGKTTAIRLMMDLLRPTSGRAAVLGFDCQRQAAEARRRIGYLPGEMPMYPELTGAEYLRFLAALSPVPPSVARLDALFRRFDVSELDLQRRMRDYSHGMKRKLGIIQALMGEPPVLILDEPTSGLDPLMIEAFAEEVIELAGSARTTVFLSSHVLSEVEKICGRIGLIRHGSLVTVRTLDELRNTHPRRVTVVFSQPVATAIPACAGITVVSRGEREWVLDVSGALGPLIAALAGLPVGDIRYSTPTLEEIVLALFEDSAGGRSDAAAALRDIPPAGVRGQAC